MNRRMSHKILFWIDDTLIHFGIANSLQNKLNCELYSIIDVTDKKKHFFEKQNFVKFKKIWFHHDAITDFTKTPSIEYLKNFEKEYEIDLWKLLYNDRVFYNFNELHTFTENQVLSIVEQQIRFFEKVLNEVKPDFISIHPVLRHSHLFYLMCKSRKIRPLLLSATRLYGRSIITSGDDDLGFSQASKIASKHASDFSLDEFLNQSMQKQVSKEASSWLQPNKEYFLAGLKFLRSKNTNHKTHYTYFGRTKFKVLTNYLSDLLRVRYRKNWIDKNLEYSIKPNVPFIYFPLHLDEEMSLLIQAPFYTNQLEIIKNIVKSLPVGYCLYVKEHPLMYARSWRKISFYEEIMNLPNVKLFHPSINADKLLRDCALVITISGTVSLDAGFFEKPAITLTTRNDIPNLSYIHQLRNVEELPSMIKKLINTKIDNNDFFSYIEYLKQNSFNLDFPALVDDYANQFFYSQFLTDVYISLEDMKKFQDKIKEKNDLIADKFIEKIYAKTNL